MLGTARRLLVESLFPSKCIGCSIRGTTLCATCQAELPYLPEGVCRRCAAIRGAAGACRACRRLSPRLGSIHAAFAYEGAARTAVLTLKFHSGRYLAPLMGELLRQEIETRPLQAEVVLPVPLAPARLRQRGYNQAVLLAEQVAEVLGGVLLSDVLARVDRPAQQTLTRTQRLRNLVGAIECQAPLAVRGRRIVLVDDVVTTAATLSACADALAEAGAERVAGLAFARDL